MNPSKTVRLYTLISSVVRALVTGFVSKGVRVAVERVMAHFRHFVHLA